MEIGLTPTELKTMMSDYSFDTGCTEYDDEKLMVFEAFSALNYADRIILCLYADNQSLRKTAKILGVSYATTRKVVAKIKSELVATIGEMKEKRDKY